MRRFLALAALCLTTACGLSDATVLTPVPYSQLRGWQQDQQSESLKLFTDSCAKLEAKSHPWRDKDGDSIGDLHGWYDACHAAAQLPPVNDDQARAFFEQHFDPYHVTTEREPQGHITGYYEPLLQGSRKRGGPFQVPVYGVPSGDRHFSREEVDNGALKGRAPILLFVDDPVMLFFMHTQGSGKVRLPDGTLIGLQYAAQNGYSFIPIGKPMKDAGMIDTISMQSIRDWLRAHPDQAAQVMEQNPSFIYFKFGPGDEYAKGAIGIPLTPARSIAIDDDRAAYGVPTYIDTTRPLNDGHYGTAPFQRLFVSQDTGGALHGPHRADIFYGRGAVEEWSAGHQNTRAEVYWLLPKMPGTVPAVPPPAPLPEVVPPPPTEPPPGAALEPASAPIAPPSPAAFDAIVGTPITQQPPAAAPPHPSSFGPFEVVPTTPVTPPSAAPANSPFSVMQQ